MWMPGTSKPTARGAQARVGSLSPSTGAVHDDTQQKDLLPSPKTLSGTTRNMRFMQKKRDSVPTPPPTESVGNVAMEVATPKADPSITSSSHTPSSTTFPQHLQPIRLPMDVNGDLRMVARAVVPTIATPADMYGVASQVVGRRSFNSMNKHTEQIRQLSHHAYRQQQQHEAGAANSHHLSDRQLLQRYAGRERTPNDAIGSLRDSAGGGRSGSATNRGLKRASGGSQLSPRSDSQKRGRR